MNYTPNGLVEWELIMNAMICIDPICYVCWGHDEKMPVNIGEGHRICSDKYVTMCNRDYIEDASN